VNRYDRLLQLLKKEFPTAAIELTDDSVEHAGHKHGHDGETHYRVRIRDTGFAGLTRLQMHRRIIAAVQSEIDAGLHSFVIEDCGT
jgi:BolA protein